MMEHITRLSTSPTTLHEAKRGKCRLIDRRRDRQSIISLMGGDGFPGHRSKHPIDRSIVVTGARQLFLNTDGHLVRRQTAIAVDWPVIRIGNVRIIAPCRKPVTRTPAIPAAVHKHDAVVM